VSGGFRAGVYDGMPEREYFADPVPGGSLSCSGAKLLLPPSCPALFRYTQDHPVFKDVFDFGSAAHKMVLGAGPRIALVDAKDWRTNAAKEARDAARAEGATPLLIAEFDKVTVMADAIRGHPLASVLLNPEHGGKPEQSLFWQDEGTGIWRRSRLDWMPDWHGYGRYIVTDYKTCDSASPAAITKAVTNYGYYQQDPFYCDGIRAVGVADDPAFLFVFQEKTPPYLVTVVQLDDDARAAGRERNRQAIERYRDCTEAGVWPAYSDDIELISLPPWAARAYQESL
jgi:hypothetical protein